MPNRIIKESINESRDLTSCTFFAQDLFKRLITYADDYGRFNADPQIMIARLYPRELSIVDISDLMDAIIELVGVSKIAFYTSQPRHEVFGCFPKWDEHQRIRDSKKKAPDPTDTTVNDWYYRRFIPIDMKAEIIARDGFKCQICGKRIAEATDAKKLVKMCTGSFHFDHIIPCNQGGRVTYENIRLTCQKCNQSRKKTFDYDEILRFSSTGSDLQELAASCRELQPNPIRNPIQSESYSEFESNANNADKPRGEDSRFNVFWKAYPRKTAKEEARKAYTALMKKKDAPTIDRLVESVEAHKRSDDWKKDDGRFIPHPATYLRQGRYDDEIKSAQKQEVNNADRYAITEGFKTSF